MAEAGLVNGWTTFFEEVFHLTEGAERQYGIANVSYSDYVVERLELTINTCSSMLDCVNGSAEQELEECSSQLSHLLKCLHIMQKKWEEYKDCLEADYLPVHPERLRTPFGRGRPRFDVSKAQIEYLSSLSFTWVEIAAIIGISRMTLYR